MDKRQPIPEKYGGRVVRSLQQKSCSIAQYYGVFCIPKIVIQNNWLRTTYLMGTTSNGILTGSDSLLIAIALMTRLIRVL